jgi:hypothetical protein
MSTRSRIAVKVSKDVKINGRDIKDNQVIHVYNHHDGYPDSMLPGLANYSTEEAVIELISHGDMSSLGDTCANTVFYGRDRGEDHAEFAIGGWAMAKNYEEYAYIFKNGAWSND